MTNVLRQDNYKNIIPSAKTLGEVIKYLKRLYGTTERGVTASSVYASLYLLF